jgi:AsmA-like C-terminal region
MARGRSVLTVLAAALLLAVAALSLVEFDATRLGRAVLQRAGAVTGGTLTARSFRLRPLRGLVLDGVEAGAAFTGGRASASIDRLVLDHRPLRLLWGEVAVDRLVFERPHVRLAEAASARAAAPPAAAAPLGRLSLRVSRIDIEEGTVELQAAGAPGPVLVRGLDLRLRDVALDPGPAPLLAALSGTGDVRVAEVSFARTRALDVRGRVRLGGGRLKTDGVRLRTDQGAFEATLDADLRRLPLAYTLAVSGDGLDVAAILGARGFGAGTLQLDATGVGTEAEGLQGRGRLRVREGTLPSTPLLQAIERALGRTRIVGAAYQPIDAPFRVERGRVILDGLELKTDSAGLGLTGWASLAGPLELSVAVRLPREGLTVRGIGGDVLDLLTDDQGRVAVPLKVTGTQQAPRVAPDAAALAAVAERAGARKLLDKAGRGLGRLLEGKPRPN